MQEIALQFRHIDPSVIIANSSIMKNMNQSIRNTLNVALIITALSVAYGVASYASTYSQTTSLSARSFSVEGEGSVAAVPDIAEFTFGVLTEGGSDLTALQNENAMKINSVIDFLKANGVDKEDIKTQNLNINPRYQYSNCFEGRNVCPPPEIVGYTINQSVRVKVRDLNNVGDLFAGVVDNGANTASNLRFTIDDATEFENEARAEAIAEAERKAKSTAKAAGVSLGKLLSIDEFDNQPTPYYGIGGALESRADSIAPSIEPGTEEISIRVLLRYEIK